MPRSIKQQRQAAQVGDANAVLVRDRRSTKGGKSKATWIVSADLAPIFDAVGLADAVSMKILDLHFEAISTGTKANGSGNQPRLAPEGAQGALARAGKRPNIRGVTSSARKFPDHLTRTKLRILKKPRKMTSGVLGTSVACTIEPDKVHKRYVNLEASGEKTDVPVEFFYTDGRVDEAINAIVNRWLGLAIEGETIQADTGEQRPR